MHHKPIAVGDTFIHQSPSPPVMASFTARSGRETGDVRQSLDEPLFGGSIGVSFLFGAAWILESGCLASVRSLESLLHLPSVSFPPL